MKASQYYGGSHQESKEGQESFALREKAIRQGYTVRHEPGKVIITIKPCQHPPARLYSWFVDDPVDGRVLCICCCECGEVLAGGA